MIVLVACDECGRRAPASYTSVNVSAASGDRKAQVSVQIFPPAHWAVDGTDTRCPRCERVRAREARRRAAM